jgi:hypothetical protein
MSDDFKRRMELPNIIDREKIQTFREETEREKKLLNDNNIKIVSKRMYNLLEVLSIMLVLTIAAGVGGFLYLSYNGNYKTLTQLACSNVSLTCPAQVPCPSTTCPDCNCPDSVCSPKINCFNSTS